MQLVKLLKPHTDAGRQFEADTVLTVETWCADWLIKNHVAELVTEEQPKATFRLARKFKETQ